MNDVEVITYGGGELLWKVFIAISMLFYGEEGHGIIRPICVMVSMIGGVWAISKCFFHPYLNPFLTSYFLPLLALPSLFILPQTKVHIIDQLNDRQPFVIEKVPFLFAKIVGFSSSLGYELTTCIEKVMHTPDDVKYCKTGMIFGSETCLDMSRLRINNGTLAQNLHQFGQQCVIYDIALGRYSIDELKSSTDLWNFLEDRTSKVRMIQYLDPESQNVASEFLTCKQAVQKMKPLFSNVAENYKQHAILSSLPLTLKTLLNFKNISEDKIKDQLNNSLAEDELAGQIITVNAFNDVTSRFASERAKANQRSIYQTAGSLAGSGLVTARIVLEALIYACFPLIFPFVFLPSGIKFLLNWIFLNIWIQLWPSLYAVINYITLISASKYVSSITGGLSGYSMFTSVGFQDLAYDTAALGGYLSLSVPVISFYLLQSIQSLSHLTGSIMTPFHSASTTAAAEQSTGNYSFANASMGQISYDNQNAFQHNTSAVLSAGYFTDNSGTQSITYGSNGVMVNQNPSNLNTSIQTAEAYTQQLQKAEQNAQSQVETSQNSYTETRGIAERSIADIVQHVANSESYSKGYSTSESQNVQESANWILNAAENWGHHHGISTRESLEYFSGMGLDVSFGFSAKGGHSGNINALSEESRQSAESLVTSKDFQEHYQNVLSSVENESSNAISDEGWRFVENYANSMEKLKSNQTQYSSALSNLNQISENLSYVQNHTNSVNTNLNSEFANWLNERGCLSYLLDGDKESELNSLRNNFIDEKCRLELYQLEKQSPSSANIPDLEAEWNIMKSNSAQKAENIGLRFDSINDQQESLIGQNESMHGNIEQKLRTQRQQLNNQKEDARETFNLENSRPVSSHLHQKFGTTVQQIWKDASNFFWFDDYSNPK